ncbi:MAG: TIGR03960 family B12-binding radical SAM protein [Oscillospiraceae bacterium]
MTDYTLEKILREVQKPGRYVGGERGAVHKDPEQMKLRFAFCFPDTYEVGMSHLGLKILYDVLNANPDIWCERAFEPWFDMLEQMEQHSLLLTTLESGTPLRDFDVVGFTLQYEMSYPGVLCMLDRGGIPLLSRDRDESWPLVIAGGPCVCNPEPMADFVDLFLPGEGEEVIVELCEIVIKAKEKGWTRLKMLSEAAKISGVYVSRFYKFKYCKDGTIAEIEHPKKAPLPVVKRIIRNFDTVRYPKMFPVPLIEAVHDRANLEVLRGCVRGCRFCQAGFIYRPFRPKSVEVLNAQARELCANTGYEELSLVSLSTSDHPQLEKLLDELLEWTPGAHINLSLPSLRIDNFSDELIEKTSRVRKTGLTFAPEAGTQRLRDVINKNISEEEIFNGCSIAFDAGYTSVKLYFMIGLPYETDDDIVGIAKLAQKIVDLYYSQPNKPRGKGVNVSVSCACFVPKPFTPFEFCAQDTAAEFERKQRLLVNSLTSKKISLSWHDPSTSFIEAVLARGDRRLGAAILEVYKNGGIFESWDEGFSVSRWENAFSKIGINPSFYANRERDIDEMNPWETLDYGVDKRYLVKEYERAKMAATTPKCSAGCSGCGVTKFLGRSCFD